MKSIILANAPIKNDNRGCVALTISTMAIIDSIFREADEEYKLYLIDSGIQGEEIFQYYVEGIPSLNYIPCSHFLSGVKTFFKNILKNKSLNIKTFLNADYILDIGQGDSFSDIYGKKRFDLIDKIHREARLFRKPYCLLPQTMGPFKNSGIRQQAIKSIEKASLVMARDKQSFDYVKNVAPTQKNVEEYIDVAFFMPYKKMEFAKGMVHVGFNISALLWNGGYSKDNQFGFKGNYQQVVRSIIDYFLSLPDVCLHLIGHVVGVDRHIENDYATSYDLWMEYDRNPRLILAPLALSPIDIKGYIAGMDFFLGARMHATIGAFSAGVPVVPMAYSRKFNGLFIETLQYPYVADLKILSEIEVIDVVKKAFENRDNLKSIIDDRMSDVVTEREKMLKEDLKNFLKVGL